MNPEKTFNEAQIIIVDGVVIKNNLKITDSEALTAKPYEIPPKGYRLVTEEEQKNKRPPCAYMWFRKCTNQWEPDVVCHIGWGVGNDGSCIFAAPEGYTFERPVRELTVAEISDIVGCQVKIIEGE